MWLPAALIINQLTNLSTPVQVSDSGGTCVGEGSYRVTQWKEENAHMSESQMTAHSGSPASGWKDLSESRCFRSTSTLGTLIKGGINLRIFGFVVKGVAATRSHPESLQLLEVHV